MGSGPTIVRLARGGSSALDLDTEAGRAFLQERLALYNKLAFMISGAFFVVGAVLLASGVASPGEVAGAQSRRASLLHGTTLVVQLAAWVACTRGRRFPFPALRTIDVSAHVLACLGSQPPARVAHVLRQVASALVEAHGIGLVHRDVKPENILLCERGGIPDVAKVVDFGLVKDLERGGAALSLADVVQGTPLYLSPEAITAPDRVDARGDLYALGAVGYYMVTGRHVFSGATLVEVCSHHLHTAPEPPSARLGRPVPAALEAILLACLEKDPARRPASAHALRDALREVPGVAEWSEEDARAWWQRWRSQHTKPAEGSR